MDLEISNSYKKDSIMIENIVELYTYSDKNTLPVDAVRFKIKVTNLGNKPIPNMRVSNRLKYLELYFNGKNSYDMNISNGIERNDETWTLGKNESDIFETSYILSENMGTPDFGNPVEVRWSYLGINSSTVVVDLLNKKIIEN